MKVNVIIPGIHQEDTRDNYLNVQLRDCEKLPNAEIIELNLNDCLDYLANREQFLEMCLSKIRYNGIIKIIGTDLDEVARAVDNKYLSLNETRSLLYNNRSSASTVSEIINFFTRNQFKILNSRVNNYVYFVTAVRNVG